MSRENINVANPKDTDFLIKQLRAHNEKKTGATNYYKPISLVYREDTEIKAGISGKLQWNWLIIDYLWVDNAYRSKGIGSQLLSEIEALAKKQGADQAMLSSFSFQAPKFYEKNGYQCFASLDNSPTGHSEHFFKKQLL